MVEPNSNNSQWTLQLSHQDGRQIHMQLGGKKWTLNDEKSGERIFWCTLLHIAAHYRTLLHIRRTLTVRELHIDRQSAAKP